MKKEYITQNGTTLKKNKSIVQTHQKWPIQFILIAVVILLITFSMLPLGLTIINSTKTHLEVESNVFALPKGNIFQTIAHNYKYAWTHETYGIGKKFLPSIGIALIGAFFETAISAALAYILCFKDFYFKRLVFMFFISILLVPSIIGYPVLTPLVKNFLHLGGKLDYIGFLLPMIGGCQVGGMFLFKTFFGQQPKSLYECARIEGCSDFEIFFKITIPLSLPIILYYAVGAFSAVYNNFLWSSLILTGDHINIMNTMYNVTDAIKANNESGAVYAMYMISTIPLIFTTAISMKFFKGGEFAAGLKL